MIDLIPSIINNTRTVSRSIRMDYADNNNLNSIVHYIIYDRLVIWSFPILFLIYLINYDTIISLSNYLNINSHFY